MSRLFGERSLTMRSPIRTCPSVISSSPPTMRSAVVLPQPEGPTSTMNSSSAISRLNLSTARVPSLNTLETPSNITSAICSLLHRATDQTAHERALRQQEHDRDGNDRDQ